ncbi:SGNH/GDSL hydrolase family protein [Ornithinicoccus halotolerans]|uniref:SGNH/GDSL hydrolase family protein n=1 Tax=Ornithinicoccus halotolerans TaxID=1748220 RepID=UPI0012951836|nr:SGNH/GDSL hydrolase family protein [Ornithinicoccus halotolerans]
MRLPRSWTTLVAGLALAAPLLLAGGPTTAAPPPQVEAVALGDSYAAGVGAPPAVDGCGRTGGSYPARVDGRRRIDLVAHAACGGASTSDVISSQLEQLDAGTDLVTLTVGGNDIGWSQALAACLLGSDAQCQAAVTAASQAIALQLPGRMDATLTAVTEAAPEAHVVVTGYPLLFSPEYGDTSLLSVAEQRAVNAGVELLNGVLAAAAAAHGAQYLDVTSRFEGHGIGSPEPWIHGPSPDLSVAFHPTAEGYNAYAAALTSGLRTSDLR